MDNQAFAASPCGRVIRTRTGYHAFSPDPLAPSITWSSAIAGAVERAGLQLGRLTGTLQGEAGLSLPLLLARDAVGGVRSEGRALSMSQFFHETARGSPQSTAVRLAQNYLAATTHARDRLLELPVSLRLFRELHFVLLDGVADPRSTPGQFRLSQNWLGRPGCTLNDAEFVPPPVPELLPLLDNWERFLHEVDGLPGLVRMSLAHYQYLVMQPFLDMNALAGAVIAPVILQHLGITPIPLKVFGRLLERHAASMQNRMLDTCARGRWEEWLTWYLYSLADASAESVECVTRLRQLHEKQKRRVRVMDSPESTERILELFHSQPVMRGELVTEQSGLAPCDVAAALARLEAAGLLSRASREEADTYCATDIIAHLEASSMTGSPYRLPF